MQRIIVFGGKGFVGSKIVRHLQRKNYQVITAGRSLSSENHIQCDILNTQSVFSAIKKNDIVINLVGLSPLSTPKGITYQEAHVEGVKNILLACKEYSCRLLHMSALGADIQGKTEYLRTKGLGEHLVLSSDISSQVFCPSMIYDVDSEIISLFQKVLPLHFFPSITATFQPVHLSDVASIFVKAVEGSIPQRKIQIASSKKYSLYQMAQLFAHVQNRRFFPIPIFLVHALLYPLAILRLFGYNRDVLSSFYLDSITKSPYSGINYVSYEEWLSKKF